MPYLETIIATVIAYLFGSFSSSIILSKILGLPDPRTRGSKNPGATNMLRIGGKKTAFLTLLGDALKGTIPVVAAKWYGIDTVGMAFVCLAAFFGHLYPLYFRFQGGKGVATAFGCMIGIAWPVAVALIVTWIILLIVFRYSSVAAIGAAVLGVAYTGYFSNSTFTIMAAIMSFFVVYRHHSNIRNLLIGKEEKIGKT